MPDIIAYIMLYSSKPGALDALADALGGAASREEFEARALEVMELMVYLEEKPWLHLLARKKRLTSYFDRTFPANGRGDLVTSVSKG